MVIASGDQRRSSRRTERGGVELGVAQSRICNSVQCRCRDHASKRTANAIPLIVGHDEQDIGCTLGRHYARRPPWLGLRGKFLDGAAELRRRWWKLFALKRRRSAWRTRNANDLLGYRSGRKACAKEDAQ